MSRLHNVTRFSVLFSYTVLIIGWESNNKECFDLLSILLKLELEANKPMTFITTFSLFWKLEV